jgi:hypothetical protein
MHPATSVLTREGENLPIVFEIAREKGRKSALLTATRPGTTAAEEQRDNAILRLDLRNIGLPYWLLFGEWRDLPDLPTGEWQRYVFVDGTDRDDFSNVLCQLMEQHDQRAALLSADGQASIIRNTGEAAELGRLDFQPAIAAYGRALCGTGSLTLVRAFVPVGVFGATVRTR